MSDSDVVVDAPEQPAQTGGEIEVPPQGGQPSAPTTQPAAGIPADPSAQPVQPVEGTPPSTEQPAGGEPAPTGEGPTFQMPGTFARPEDEVGWLRNNYAQAMNTVAEMRQQIQDWELAGLDEQEREREVFNREKAEWQQQMDEWRSQQELLEWRSYFNQFTDKQQELASMTNPVEMTHSVLTDLMSTIDTLTNENAALKKAAGQTTPGPQVTTGGQGTSSGRSLVNLPRDEREALMERARMGLIQESDFPGV